jgi:hypothetical protein
MRVVAEDAANPAEDTADREGKIFAVMNIRLQEISVDLYLLVGAI